MEIRRCGGRGFSRRRRPRVGREPASECSLPPRIARSPGSGTDRRASRASPSASGDARGIHDRRRQGRGPPGQIGKKRCDPQSLRSSYRDAEHAEAHLGEEINRRVLHVPAYLRPSREGIKRREPAGMKSPASLASRRRRLAIASIDQKARLAILDMAVVRFDTTILQINGPSSTSSGLSEQRISGGAIHRRDAHRPHHLLSWKPRHRLSRPKLLRRVREMVGRPSEHDPRNKVSLRSPGKGSNRRIRGRDHLDRNPRETIVVFVSERNRSDRATLAAHRFKPRISTLSFGRGGMRLPFLRKHSSSFFKECWDFRRSSHGLERADGTLLRKKFRNRAIH